MSRSQRDEGGTYLKFRVNASGTPSSETGDVIGANGTGTITISNVAHDAVGTATISRWLQLRVDGTGHFIPMWT